MDEREYREDVAVILRKFKVMQIQIINLEDELKDLQTEIEEFNNERGSKMDIFNGYNVNDYRRKIMQLNEQLADLGEKFTVMEEGFQVEKKEWQEEFLKENEKLEKENKRLNEKNKHLTSLLSQGFESVEPKEVIYLNGHQMTTLMQNIVDDITEKMKREQESFKSMNIGLFHEEELIEAKDLLQKVLTLNRFYLTKEAGGIEEIVIRLEKGEEKNG